MNTTPSEAMHDSSPAWIRRTVKVMRWVLIVWTAIAVLTFLALLLFGTEPYRGAARGITGVAMIAATIFFALMIFPPGRSWREWLPGAVEWSSGMVLTGLTFSVSAALAVETYGDVWGVYGLYFLLSGVLGSLVLRVCKVNLAQHDQDVEREQARKVSAELRDAIVRLGSKVDAIERAETPRRWWQRK